ncbi:uncharacterized protein LOC113320084 [Papaver somniferum]|uniref:uncharacterized protein LOC113320084 n=1 Tax=Papaver somniferum TaxID=3469 RepID=UPI000E6F83F3|nr:uncharacterized protein LOC113320084 [Papaver somniferum]
MSSIYVMFYKQRNINVKSFIQNTLKAGGHLSYISPEIGFLKSLSGVLTKATEVIFLFLAEDAMEPTTKQTYKSILAEIASIKTVEVAKTMAVSGVLISIKFADAVVVGRPSAVVVTTESGFSREFTNIVMEFRAVNLTVCIATLANEFTSNPKDLFSDPQNLYLCLRVCG